MNQRFGIDVSHWQGSFDFARAKSKEGVEFAIIKAGGVRNAGFQREHISMEMPEAWQKQRKRQDISFHSLRGKSLNILFFMM